MSDRHEKPYAGADRGPRVLMCPPEHFDVSYVINPWMDGNVQQTVGDQAHAQWNALREAVSAVATVELMEAAEGLPDMPFTANAGLVHGRTFIPSRFRHAQRRGEEAHFESWFAAHGFKVRTLPSGMFFEGAGDALFERGARRLWMGHGHRSDGAAASAIAELLGVDTLALRLADERFYHLDTCFCPLTGGHLLYYPPAFDVVGRALIEQHVPPERRIVASESDALAFACNAVSLGDTVILNRASAELRERLASAGYTVVQTPMDEFLKSGGAAKCLTLRLDEPPSD